VAAEMDRSGTGRDGRGKVGGHRQTGTRLNAFASPPLPAAHHRTGEWG